nr:hypothetical protein [uncultured Oscillibacter sp.]
MKTWKHLVSGLLALTLLASLAGSALAAAGKLQIGTGGVVVMDKVMLTPGQEYKAENENIPGYIVYEGPSGKTYNYVPVEMVADYLDIPSGWSEKRNSVVLGPTSEGLRYQVLTDEDKSIVDAPVLGMKVGPFTEIDPKTVDTSEGPAWTFEDETVAETWTGFSTGRRMSTIGGRHLLLTVTNNGDTPVICTASRACMINGYEGGLSNVRIQPGQTLTRAFEIDEDVDRIHNEFVASVSPETVQRINVTVSFKRYK